MNLEQFVKDATVTESIKEEVNVNFTLVTNALSLFIQSGQILDQIKKNAFYGKPFKHIELSRNITISVLAADNLLRLNRSAIDFNNERINTTTQDSRIIHSLLGICTESTEMAEALYDYVENNDAFDLINLSEEAGDLDWYKAILSDASGISMEQVLETVINKLKARYPEGFTSHHAINRNLEHERALLESSLQVFDVIWGQEPKSELFNEIKNP